MTPDVGFIGAGLMGHGVARNILEKGYALSLLGHRNRGPVEDLVRRGARELKSPADLAKRSDVLFTCLPNSEVVEQVVCGEEGVLEGAREGLVLVDLTTGAPEATRCIAARAAEKGVRMLDAPMTLTPKEAEEGRLNLLVGGDPALFEELRPIFLTFNERIFHVGPLGAAHTLKLINNFLSQGNLALVVLAITTAARAGVDARMMHEVISVSGGNSVVFQRASRIFLGEDAGGGGAFAIKNALKDVRYFTELAEAQGVYAPLADAVRRFFHLAVALDYGEELLPKLFEVQDRLSGGGSRPRG
jgi:3-hydroxyisobutyrate dehydrogenase-like beta-hydroxyacid dehydrogenase